MSDLQLKTLKALIINSSDREFQDVTGTTREDFRLKLINTF